MSRSLNKVMLIGNVGGALEVRATSSGARIAKVSLATNRSWTDRESGEKRETTEWHRLTFFGRLVDFVEQWVTKGDRLYVEGRIEYSRTEGEAGTRYWTDIVVEEMVMLGSSGGGGGERRPAQAGADRGSDPSRGSGSKPSSSSAEPADGLPF